MSVYLSVRVCLHEHVCNYVCVNAKVAVLCLVDVLFIPPKWDYITSGHLGMQ